MVIILSCSKETAINEPTTIDILLTEKPWILSSFGFDENRNNKVDLMEENIEDCQKDNTWYYYNDGTGLIDDKVLSCATGIDKQPFTWKLSPDKTLIDFFHDSFKILQINDTEMNLYKELTDVEGNSLKFIFVFRH